MTVHDLMNSPSAALTIDDVEKRGFSLLDQREGRDTLRSPETAIRASDVLDTAMQVSATLGHDERLFRALKGVLVVATHHDANDVPNVDLLEHYRLAAGVLANQILAAKE